MTMEFQVLNKRKLIHSNVELSNFLVNVPRILCNMGRRMKTSLIITCACGLLIEIILD